MIRSINVFVGIADRLRVLQAGSLHLYLAYMFVTLVLLLLFARVAEVGRDAASYLQAIRSHDRANRRAAGDLSLPRGAHQEGQGAASNAGGAPACFSPMPISPSSSESSR